MGIGFDDLAVSDDSFDILHGDTPGITTFLAMAGNLVFTHFNPCAYLFQHGERNRNIAGPN